MKIRSVYPQRVLVVLFSLTLVASLFPTLALAADADFKGNSAFLTKWQRTDKAVAEGRSSRSWLWGPNVISITTEPYAESPGGVRSVAYLDKARMEINDPSKNFVSNGLLVKELISGQEALGDAKTLPRLAADISVAGDPGNPGPTYASFSKVSTLNNTDNNAVNRVGQPVDDTIVRDGTTGKNGTLGQQVKVAYYEPNLKHNIPDVFWNFMNQKGTIWDGSKYTDNQLVFDWLDAMGFPISEAYWSQVVVGGQSKNVLIQAFERRVLTYTPTNSPAYQVEMGNVGQHYLTWRSDKKYDNGTPGNGGGNPAPQPQPPGNPLPPGGPTSSGPFDCSTAGIPKDRYTYLTVKCGPAGFQQIAVATNMTDNESVKVTLLNSAGQAIGSVINVNADRGIVVTRFDVPLSATAGDYSLILQGNISGAVATGFFRVAAPYAGPSVALTPNSGTGDTVVTVMFVGFTPGEKIEISYTSPTGVESFIKKPQQTVGTTGGYTTLLTPKLEFLNITPGNWKITAKSVSDPAKSATATLTIS